MDETRLKAPLGAAPAHIPPEARGEEPTGPALSAEEVVREYGARVYNLARRMVNSDADAEDVTQDVLLQVVRKLPTFRGEASLPTWLHRVTVNAALMHRRARATRDVHHSKDPLDLVLEDADKAAPLRRWSVNPAEAIQDRETQELIDRAIAALPVAYRDVFVLSDVEGLPNAEIGDLFGLSLPAVKSRLHRARQMLRGALAPHFEDVSA